MSGNNNSYMSNSSSTQQTISTVASPTVAPVSPSLADEVAYISGVNSMGSIAAISSQTWNGDGQSQDGTGPDTIATYNTVTSNASKWAPGGPSAAPSAAGTPGGTQLYYFDPAASFSSAQEGALASGLTLWSAVADIQFAETTIKADASLIFQGSTTGGTYESAPNRTGEAINSPLLSNQGTGVFLNLNTDPNNGGFPIGDFNDGGSGIGAILHEEGHFLGLGHAGPYNGAVNNATQQYSAYDSHEYSLMSYVPADDPTGKYAASYPLGSATNPMTELYNMDATRYSGDPESVWRGHHNPAFRRPGIRLPRQYHRCA
jgi:hypothetical protein